MCVCVCVCVYFYFLFIDIFNMHQLTPVIHCNMHLISELLLKQYLVTQEN